MADFFKPRRGTQLKAIEALNGENKLRAGELFFELEYEGSTKTVKSGRIMIGDGTSNYADLVTNDRYVFNPDDYMGVTSKFEPTPSTETTITDNRDIINSANTNIKEKMGAIDATIDLLDENKSEKTHNHTTADITDFVASVKSIKVDNASTADYATNAGTANYATIALKDSNGNKIASTYVTNTTRMIDCGVFSTGSFYAYQTNNSYDQFTLNADSYGTETFKERTAFVLFNTPVDDIVYESILDMTIYIVKKWSDNTESSAIYKLKDPVILKSPQFDMVTGFTATMEKESDIYISSTDSLKNTLYLQFSYTTSHGWELNFIREASSGPALNNMKVNIHNVKYSYYTDASTDNE